MYLTPEPAEPTLTQIDALLMKYALAHNAAPPAPGAVPTNADRLWGFVLVDWFRRSHALGIPLAGLPTQMSGAHGARLLSRWLLLRPVLLAGL
jgi:hypothetical protein